MFLSYTLCILQDPFHYFSSRKPSKKQCWESVTFRCRSGSAPLTNGSGSNSGSDSFFSDFKDAKKNFFSYFFLVTNPHRHIIFSLKIFYFLQKCCVKILYWKHYFILLNTFLRKGKDPEQDLCLWLMYTDGPKKCGSCGFKSPTLLQNIVRVKEFSPPWTDSKGSRIMNYLFLG